MAQFVSVFTLPPARCESDDGARSAARAVWAAQLEIPSALVAQARDVRAGLTALPGRVVSGGRFELAQAQAVLCAALPSSLRDALRPRFEWYGCRGAFFHNDAHYGDVLFGAWCVLGPRRQVVFARAARAVSTTAGGCVVFDPFEPHAVLDENVMTYDRTRYEAAEVNVFLGFELALTAVVRAAFGIDKVPPASPLLASRVPVNAETGGLS